MTQADYNDVLQANLKLSAASAPSYNETEPHYLPENIERVRGKLSRVVETTDARRMLDLGCGTGFLIDIAREMVDRIHGVDASPDMLGRVDLSGPAEVTVEQADTGAVSIENGTFDMVTAYSFFHHLYDVVPTLTTAYNALRPGGQLYVDLEPNKVFWDGVKALPRDREYDPVVAREISMVADHEGVALQTGVDPDVFHLAEWGKTATGGIDEDRMTEELLKLGFSRCEFFYEWFVGQGILINNPDVDRAAAMSDAAAITDLLTRAMPLSKNLFKYVGFVATK